MHIKQLQVKNFRLLEDVVLLLEEKATVIVGRNNSGKTSLTELFRRFTTKATRFALEDFSLDTHERFWTTFINKNNGVEAIELRKMLPYIEVEMILKYDSTASNLGSLGKFIVDLDPDCDEAKVVFRYQLRDGSIDPFFANITVDATKPEAEQKKGFFRTIRERIPAHFEASVLAVDPADENNKVVMEFADLQRLLHTGFINAQRGLDDVTDKERNVLSQILEALLNTAMAETAIPSDRGIVQNLEDAIQNIQQDIDTGFNQQLKELFPAFTLFGYPGLRDPGLMTETTLDVKRLLQNNTKVHYAGVNGINLPEAYNGLGVRNLIYILLRLLEFYKVFRTQASEPGVHLIFIEEPEVHLHPQMQEVFISKLTEIAKVFEDSYNPGVSWPVQFVVTTHSSHVANKAPFESMRYFLTGTDATGRHTEVKDLRKGLGGTTTDDRDFLHKYMTLTRCDLLFADKAILIEGLSERLLLPKMIEKIDVGQPLDQRLGSDYISIIEVGGAYAHRFFGLIDFLGLRTLIVTDIDSADRGDGGKACKVSVGTHSTNACINSWFPGTGIAPRDLIPKPIAERTTGTRCLTYQVPETEGAPCGRSFEGAFMLANPPLFSITGESSEEIEDSVWTKGRELRKSDFALKYAIEETGWNVPRYIAEGLKWLRDDRSGSSTTANQQEMERPQPQSEVPA